MLNKTVENKKVVVSLQEQLASLKSQVSEIPNTCLSCGAEDLSVEVVWGGVRQFGCVLCIACQSEARVAKAKKQFTSSTAAIAAAKDTDSTVHLSLGAIRGKYFAILSYKEKSVRKAFLCEDKGEAILSSLIWGLEQLNRPCSIRVKVDSANFVQFMNDNGLERYKTKNFSGVKYSELWQKLSDILAKGHQVEFVAI